MTEIGTAPGEGARSRQRLGRPVGLGANFGFAATLEEKTYLRAFGSGATSVSCALRGPVRSGMPVINAL